VRVRSNVRRYFFQVFAWIFALSAAHAAVCNPRAIPGAYGFSLTGTTTIGGPARPVAVVGRVVVDDSGNLSGISSASFTGLVFGNRVTGKVLPQTDCSVTLTMQDDSGNFQHFAGTVNADSGRVAFRQTDPGGAQNGILLRTTNGCSASSLTGTFKVKASGRTVDPTTGVDSGHVLSRGVLIADGVRSLSFDSGPDEPALAAGSYEVAEDCFVTLGLELPVGENKTVSMHFRAILVNDGREVLGIQTDPGTVVALRLVSQ
jgi:hypothetical protein